MSTEANSSVTTLMLPVKFTELDLKNFWSKVDKASHPNGCWLWTAAKDQRGYGKWLVRHGTAKSHRISWMIHNGFLPKSDSCRGVCILHKCDNPSCVNPDHLETGTQADNMLDAARKGRMPKGQDTGPAKHPESMPRGEGHWSKRFPEKWAEMHKKRVSSIKAKYAVLGYRPKRILTPRKYISNQDAWDMRALFYGGGWNQFEVANFFGVHQSAVSRVITGSRSWAFLDESPC